MFDLNPINGRGGRVVFLPPLSDIVSHFLTGAQTKLLSEFQFQILIIFGIIILILIKIKSNVKKNSTHLSITTTIYYCIATIETDLMNEQIDFNNFELPEKKQNKLRLKLCQAQV